jgi:putative transposase
LALVEREAADLPLSTQAELLQLSRASLYYQPSCPSPEEVAINHRIDELYTAHPFYGSRKLTALLRQERGPISRKTVQRHMREMGIAGICPGPNLSKRSSEHRVYPYLLRHVSAERVNHVWGIDSTYVRMQGSWMYLVAVLDWYSRFVVSWAVDETLEMPFVLETMQSALSGATPLICNSDQGSHFTSPQYTQLLRTAGVQISMDGKGRALDNIFTERLWRSVKYEHVYLREDSTPRAVRQGLEEYFDFYNNRRPHQALEYRTPAELYGGSHGKSIGTSQNTRNTEMVVAPTSGLAEVRQNQVSSIQSA